jgi:formylmethanofuran dehydrogenase subunit E
MRKLTVKRRFLMPDITELLAEASVRHSHLCPRQVLGVRMALAGMAALGLRGRRHDKRPDKRLLVIAETDGCFVDGLEVAAGTTPGHRTLRIEDYGKVAATFIDTRTGEAQRLAPRLDVRQRAASYAPDEPRHYFAQLLGYQVMPETELFSIMPVVLSPGIEDLVSRPGVRTNCAACGEEIINEREVILDGLPYCRSCAGHSYYQLSAGTLAVFRMLEDAEVLR